MKSNFLPYEQALKLKELGFNQECLGFFRSPTNRLVYGFELHNTPEHCLKISAPTWCQIFDWFRVNYGYYSNIVPNPTRYIEHQNKNWLFGYNIINSDNPMFDLRYKTYEEARLKCLEKLIELCAKQ